MNNCKYKKNNKKPSFKVNINKWIYNKLLETKYNVETNLKDYRFDEAAKNAYQFVWHSYCDWYLELSKTILFSKDKKSIAEVKEVSSYIFKQILILMHPFIPFVTEELWLKNKLDNSGKTYLMHSNWLSGKTKKDVDFKHVEKLINFIYEIRSFKNQISINPGSFIDISLNKVNKKNLKFFKENEIVLKRLGRINNFFNDDQNKPSATLVIDGSLFKLYFEQDIDLNIIKENLIKKQDKYTQEMNSINTRLSNKNFVERAPKYIVAQEKSHYNNLKNDISKIVLIIKNL